MRLSVPQVLARRAPQRFRDRLFAAMLVVALIPLASFAAVVVGDLGSMSRTAVDETHRSIVADAHSAQAAAVADRAHLIDVRLGALATQLRQLRDQLLPKLASPAPPVADTFTLYRGIYFRTSSDGAFTVMVGPSDRTAGSPAARAAGVNAAGIQLQPVMQAMLHGYPEVESVWVADEAGDSVVTVPAFDVRGAIAAGRLDPDAPLGPNGDTVFSASQKQFAATVADPGSWVGPNETARRTATSGPFWTDPYPTRNGDGSGVTVWMPLGDGRTIVGADVSIAPIADTVLSTRISPDAAAYPLLISSTNRVLAAGGSAARDFGLSSTSAGVALPTGHDRGFDTALAGVEQRGLSTVLSTRQSGVDRTVFTAPIYSAHWILATSMPTADLEPDVAALTRGVDSGIHRLLLAAIPVALVLCILAFVLARLFAKRLVGPVKALTHAAERLADGHTDDAVPPQGSDEVGVLAASLERMRREINNSRDTILDTARELEIRVRDRTAELRVRNEELVALNDLAASLTRSLEPSVILSEALAAVRAIVPVRAGRGYAGDAGRLDAAATELISSPAAGTDQGARLDRIAAAALDEGRIVTARQDDGTLIGIPLATTDGVLGALGIFTPQTGDLDRALVLLRAIADQVGLAMRTARLSAEGRATAVLEERTRLAREIHDTLAQQLTAIVLQLEAAEALVDGTGGSGRESVVLARDLARGALGEARRSVWDLRPAPLAATGLVAALESEVDRWQAHTGIPVQMRAEHLPRPLRLTPSAEVALLRITQEALSNVAKHSQATRVGVRLRGVGDELVLSIRDNGRGFDRDGVRRADAFGLIGMAERARIAGGGVEIRSHPGRGTRVIVTVPLDAPAAHERSNPASLVAQ